MTIKDMTKEQLVELIKNNKWLEQQIDELVQEQISWAQSEEFKEMGADVFDYHDHYASFYLTAPRHYGAPDGHSVAGKLQRDYLNAENMKLYDELCELADKWDNMAYDEQDENRDIEAKMDELAERLAQGVTDQLREYESMETWIETRNQELEMILGGDRYLSDLEVKDGKVKEVLWH